MRWLRWASCRPSSTSTLSSGLGSHNQLPIRQCLRHRHRGLEGSETEMRRFFGHEIEVTLSCLTLGGWDELLHHCPSGWTLPLQSNEGICFGQEFKGSPCFWPKKWKNVRAGASWRCYSRGKIAPDFFQGWFCATNALRLSDQLDTPPATPFSTFFNPDRTLAVKSVKADL